MSRHWDNISYLLQGTPRQKLAYEAIESLHIFAALESFTPTLVGTIPLKIYTAASDLDIICHADDLEQFKNKVIRLYSDFKEFSIKFRQLYEVSTVIARFRYQDFQFELFGQAVPVEKQRAFLHMLVEARLLKIGGEQARKEILKLKTEGIKTEQAFVNHFNLKGDPYQVLLQLAKFSEKELHDILKMI